MSEAATQNEPSPCAMAAEEARSRPSEGPPSAGEAT